MHACFLFSPIRCTKYQKVIKETYPKEISKFEALGKPIVRSRGVAIAISATNGGFGDVG